MRTMHRTLVLAIGLVLLAACSSAPTSGPVTIVHELDVSQEPIEGTFEVTEGADVLGCSAGTFVDDPGTSAVGRIMTCTDPGSGTFTYDFDPFGSNTWEFIDATGDFAGLTGDGDWAESGFRAETITGTIEYAP